MRIEPNHYTNDPDELALLAVTEPKPEPKPPATREQGLAALRDLTHFMGPVQRQIVRQNMDGEEAQFFYDKMVELAAIVANMPQSYDTDGQGKKTIAYLHYFAGGEANYYITEKDKGCPDDEEPGVQQQAFGLAKPFLYEDGELGYISIQEIGECRGELDFYWTPKSLEELEAEQRQ